MKKLFYFAALSVGVAGLLATGSYVADAQNAGNFVEISVRSHPASVHWIFSSECSSGLSGFPVPVQIGRKNYLTMKGWLQYIKLELEIKRCLKNESW